MKKLILAFTLIFAFSFVHAQNLDCTSISTWNATSTYLTGNTVKLNGVVYRANWWTQNNPETNSGQWQEWTVIGQCTSVNPTVQITAPTENSMIYLRNKSVDPNIGNFDPIVFSVDVNDEQTRIDSVTYDIVSVHYISKNSSVISKHFNSNLAPFQLNYIPTLFDQNSSYTEILVKSYSNGAASTEAFMRIYFRPWIAPTISLVSPVTDTHYYFYPSDVNSIKVDVTTNADITQIDSVRYIVVDVQDQGRYAYTQNRRFVTTTYPFSYTIPAAYGFDYTYVTAVAFSKGSGFQADNSLNLWVHTLPELSFNNLTEGQTIQVTPNTSFTVDVDVNTNQTQIDSVHYWIYEVTVNGQYATTVEKEFTTTKATNFDLTFTPSTNVTYTRIAALAYGEQGTFSKSKNVTVYFRAASSCTQTAWNASTAYTGGSVISHNGKVYRAKWWTQGENPAQNSSEWAVWTLLGDCGAARFAADDQPVSATEIVCAPNPAENVFYISTAQEITAVKIYNTSGMEMISLNEIQNNQVYDLTGFASGVYTVKVWLADGTVQTKKVVKN